MGIDGCRGGWIAVEGISADGRIGALRLYHAVRFAELPLEEAVAAVDMPIGLVEVGRRTCDGAARALLAKPSSVFTPPRRPMLAAQTFAEANAIGCAQGPARLAGGGVSLQAWNLAAKIREVDQWITPARQENLFEAHPELTFEGLAAGAPLPVKRSAAGRSARRALLQKAYFDLEPLEAALRRAHAGLDDLYDATVLLTVAARKAAGMARPLPPQPERDARGLAMTIWH